MPKPPMESALSGFRYLSLNRLVVKGHNHGIAGVPAGDDRNVGVISHTIKYGFQPVSCFRKGNCLHHGFP